MAHPTPVWPHHNLANYIYNDPRTHFHVLAFKTLTRLSEGDTIHFITGGLGWDLLICIPNNFPVDADAALWTTLGKL